MSPAEKDIAKRCRDQAGLLRLMDKHARPQQTSEATARLLEEAAVEIECLTRISHEAVITQEERERLDDWYRRGHADE